MGPGYGITCRPPRLPAVQPNERDSRQLPGPKLHPQELQLCSHRLWQQAVPWLASPQLRSELPQVSPQKWGLMLF